MNIEYIYMHTR